MENCKSPDRETEPTRQTRVAQLVNAVMERCRELFSGKSVEEHERNDESPEEALGKVDIEACTCHLYEIATREGLLEAEEGRPAITIEGEKFTVPEELVEWLHSKSLRARDLKMRKDAWRKLVDLLWKQESRIRELLEIWAEDAQDCAGVRCRERLELRRDLLDRLWDIASEQYWHVQNLSRNPIDAPYASCVYRG